MWTHLQLEPAFVIFHQPRRDHEKVIPTGRVWVVSNGYLLRVAPGHLKVCSEAAREIVIVAHGPAESLQDVVKIIYHHESAGGL